MAQKVRLETGNVILVSTDEERDACARLVGKPAFSSSTKFFTPKDNLEYYVLEQQTDRDRCTDTILANGKTFKVSADICSLDEKILKAVRKAYGKL